MKTVLKQARLGNGTLSLIAQKELPQEYDAELAPDTYVIEWTDAKGTLLIRSLDELRPATANCLVNVSSATDSIETLAELLASLMGMRAVTLTELYSSLLPAGTQLDRPTLQGDRLTFHNVRREDKLRRFFARRVRIALSTMTAEIQELE
ncbi:MAG: hypothetical protein U0271_15595 [Polyangiaceae bacterium]